jgi:hypothetical protein
MEVHAVSTPKKRSSSQMEKESVTDIDELVSMGKKAKTVDASKKRRSHKVRETDFTPRTRLLVKESKKVQKRRAVLNCAYPSEEKKHEYSMMNLAIAASESEVPGLMDTYKRIIREPLHLQSIKACVRSCSLLVM